jgi:flavin-dependent dehydrogenase
VARTIVIGGGTIPVLARADLVVAGASFGGISVALRAARAGHRVILADPRTFPGYETGAFHRPWIGNAVFRETPSVFLPWLGEAARGPALPGETALVPGAVKRGLERLLAEARVEILYLSAPAGVVIAEGRVAGMVVATKAGRRVLLARAVVDATPGGILSRLAGCRAVPRYRVPGRIVARRSLEFTGVKGSLPASLRVPPLGPARVRTGALGKGHVFLDVRTVLPFPGPGYAGMNAAELSARRLTMDAVERLVHGHPSFLRAAFASSSPELMIPPPFLVAGSRPGLFPLGAFAKAGPAAWAALDPLSSARAGEALWPAIRAELARVPRPRPGRCVAVCGRRAAGGGGRMILREGAPGAAGVREARSAVPVLADADVLVAGGGTCGAIAGVASAGKGARTVVVEANSGLGGTGTLGGVPVYWMGWRAGYTAMVDAWVSWEMGRMKAPARGYWSDGWYSYWSPEAKMEALRAWNEEAGSRVVFRAPVAGALVEGRRVRGALVATPEGLMAVKAGVSIDATGDGDLAAMAGAGFDYGSAPAGIPMWTHLSPVLKPGEPLSGFTTPADMTEARDVSRFIVTARRRSPAYDYMPQVAPRESRRIRGEKTVDLRDNFAFRRFPDTVAIFFSNPDVKGISDSRWFDFGIHPPNLEMELPYGSLVPRGVDGILVGGRAHSVSHDALAAMRMQPDIQNQGGALGLAAAMATREGGRTRRVDVRALQDELIRVGALPAVLRERGAGSSLPAGAVLRRLVAGLKGDEPFYIHQLETDIARELPAVAAVAAAPRGKVLPLLRREYGRSTGMRRLLLARLLAWHGSRSGAPAIAGELGRMLSGRGLPPRRTYIRNTNREGPDQGAMPEACNLIHALSHLADRRLVPLLAKVVAGLDSSREAFLDPLKGPWYYADAVIRSAERLRDRRMVPVLEALHAKPGLHGLSRTDIEEDVLVERLAILELGLGRALLACGSRRGAEILRPYLDDCRSLYAKHARAVLAGSSHKGQRMNWP